jgi:hypothetical protein
MAPCSVCNTTHPTIQGAPNDCVRALSSRVAALEGVLAEEVAGLGDQVVALAKQISDAAKARGFTAEPLLATVPAEQPGPLPPLAPPPVDSAG